jgi:DNA polymerase III delta prime subunit
MKINDQQLNDLLISNHGNLTESNKSENTGVYPFTEQQLKLLMEVRELKSSMANLIGFNSSDDNKYSHLIISGPPGLGKTYFVKSLFKERAIDAISISGSVSLYALGIRLAILNTNRDPNEITYVHVDDSDVIFKDEESCNIFKQVLFDEQEFIYEKNVRRLLSSLDESQRLAVELHMSENSIGFRVPLKNVVFVITTNVPLPTDKQIAKLLGKNGLAGIKVHRNAIRSRCRYRDLSFSESKRWAWIADVFIKEKYQSELEKNLITSMLTFLWDYRSEMNEYSIRTAEKMLLIAQYDPQNYEVTWKNEFL